MAFLLGNLAVHQLSSLDSSTFYWLISSGLFIIFIGLILGHFIHSDQNIKRLFRLGLMIVFFCFSFLFTFISAEQKLEQKIPPDWENKKVIIQGIISSVPEVTEYAVKFNFDILKWLADESVKFDSTVKISAYQLSDEAKKQFKAGDIWQLQVKLKPVSGMLNKAGFDYEKWLFQQEIRAKGTIKDSGQNQLIGKATEWFYQLTSFRQQVFTQLHSLLENNPYQGIYLALSLGIRHSIPDQHWQLFTSSGTSHLIAISGLHIGLIAGFIFFLSRFLWSRSVFLIQLVAAPRFAAIIAIVAALLYSAMAGFSIPTQRALVMLVLLLFGIISSVRISSINILAYSLILVLLIDPMSSLSMGFWLSFSAVAIILTTIYWQNTRALEQDPSQLLKYSFRFKLVHNLKQLATIQIVLFVGLLPLTILFFQNVSLISPIANFLVVPWMSLLVIPLTLLASLLSYISESLGQVLFQLNSYLFLPVEIYLSWLSKFRFHQLSIESGYFYYLLILLIFVYMVLKIVNKLSKIISVLCFVICLYSIYGYKNKTELETAQYKITALDVGQGLSILIETQNKTMLYDTGNRYPSGFNMAEQVIIPVLQSKNINHIDLLVLSHADHDHAGAAKILLDKIPVKQVISGEPGRIEKKFDLKTAACVVDSQWQWDGVTFKILSSRQYTQTVHFNNSNNSSCVIEITGKNNIRTLLTGDIEKKVEQLLVKDQKLSPVKLLIASHHGSNTSSSEVMISILKPEFVIFSAGYLNPFHFPAKRVVERFKRLAKSQNLQSQLLTTQNGMIEINFYHENSPVQIYRRDDRYYWNREYKPL